MIPKVFKVTISAPQGFEGDFLTLSRVLGTLADELPSCYQAGVTSQGPYRYQFCSYEPALPGLSHEADDYKIFVTTRLREYYPQTKFEIDVDLWT